MAVCRQRRHSVRAVECDRVGRREPVAHGRVGQCNNGHVLGNVVAAHVLGVDDDGVAAGGDDRATIQCDDDIGDITVGEPRVGEIEGGFGGVVDLDVLAAILIDGVRHDLADHDAHRAGGRAELEGAHVHARALRSQGAVEVRFCGDHGCAGVDGRRAGEQTEIAGSGGHEERVSRQVPFSWDRVVHVVDHVAPDEVVVIVDARPARTVDAAVVRDEDVVHRRVARCGIGRESGSVVPKEVGAEAVADEGVVHDHRLGIGMERDARVTVVQELVVGDELFPHRLAQGEAPRVPGEDIAQNLPSPRVLESEPVEETLDDAVGDDCAAAAGIDPRGAPGEISALRCDVKPGDDALQLFVSLAVEVDAPVEHRHVCPGASEVHTNSQSEILGVVPRLDGDGFARVGVIDSVLDGLAFAHRAVARHREPFPRGWVLTSCGEQSEADGPARTGPLMFVVHRKLHESPSQHKDTRCAFWTTREVVALPSSSRRINREKRHEDGGRRRGSRARWRCSGRAHRGRALEEAR